MSGVNFRVAPPLLVLYCGKPGHNRFFRRRLVAEATLLGEVEYEALEEIWAWERVKDAHLRGEFGQEEVDEPRLREILLYHLDRLEEDLAAPVGHAVAIIDPPGGVRPPLTSFGRWLVERPTALRRMEALYARKRAELARPSVERLTGELTTQAAINYLNKVLFLSLCEDRNLPGFTASCASSCPRPRA